MADVDFEVISDSEYQKRTRGRGRGRRSRYSALGEKAEGLKPGQAVALNGTKNQVVSIRNYFKRNHGDAYRIRSVATDEGSYDIYIRRKDDA